MKKVITMFVALALCATTFAVDVTLGGRGNLSIGAGATTATYNYQNVEPNVGGGFSFYAKTGLTDFFALQHEIGFSFNNGSKSDYGTANFTLNDDGENWEFDKLADDKKETRNTTWSIDFMPVTATWQWKFGKEKNFQVGFGVGPFISVLFPVDHRKKSVEHYYGWSWKSDIAFGLVGEAFFGIKAGPGNVVLNTRYMYNGNIRNGLSFGVGYEYTF